MANNIKMLALVERLTEKSKSQEIRWEETSTEKSYMTSFPNFSVVIKCQNVFIDNDVQLEVYNDEGIVIDTLAERDGLTLEQYMSLKDLYKIARSSALHAEQALDNLLQHLDTAKQLN